MRSTKSASLPLRYQTPPEWAQLVLEEPLDLLSDQAYLEKKAANNALEFLNLWPTPQAPAHWLSSVSTIARDETTHLAMVLKLLQKRGGNLARTHKNQYAIDLRGLVRTGKGKQDMADRLLVSALIEARSCERFERLAECGTEGDAELARFYAGLVSSENGHYRLFVDMAKKILPSKEVDARWEKLLDEEAEIIQAQVPGPRIHSGVN
jgi:tRNA 2-(methylsulfanyl)-N6-isopentenyladenosine37 hydroxylase